MKSILLKCTKLLNAIFIQTRIHNYQLFISMNLFMYRNYEKTDLDAYDRFIR